MAFSTLSFNEMIIKSTILLILVHLLVIKVVLGHLGCAGDLVPCLNETHCINIEEVCVDYHDCVDKRGDKICHYCKKGQTDTLACVTHIEDPLTFECLSPHQICDNKKDCINNEDEHLCGTHKCKIGSWLCANGTCIDKSQICDSKVDCPDGSDEGPVCHQNICKPDKMRCPTGECIPKSKICDGTSHCSDGYDEQQCIQTILPKVNDSCPISPNTFPCSLSSVSTHQICLEQDRVCDGYKDCPMGDDELQCNNECRSKSKCPANVDIICIQHPALKQLCRCRQPGYRLTSDSLKCQDLNECNDSLRTYCSFNCVNTDGSFDCTCPSGFTLDKETKTCQRKNDWSKPNLLIVFDDSIYFYNIFNSTGRYDTKLINTTDINKNHRFDHIQYDPKQMFVIYYDQIQHTVFCKPHGSSKSIVLLSNLTVQSFAYNANEKTLFVIESQSKTLRMYGQIICEAAINIKMHSWPLNISISIHSMELDVYNRQLIFSSNYQFMTSNLSEPNSLKTVYTTDRKIERVIYDASFKRIFWIGSTIPADELFTVYTCTDEFKQCHNTSIALPSAQSFAFFNDALIFSPSSRKSLDIIQLYGTHRLSTDFITSTPDFIRTFLLIDHEQMEVPNLCSNHTTTRCKDNELCLQNSSTTVQCLSVNQNSTTLISTENSANSMSQHGTQSLEDEAIASQIAHQQKPYRYLPSNTIVLWIIIGGVLVIVLALFVKRYHTRLSRKGSRDEQTQHERCLATYEPYLDEFTIMSNDGNGDRLPLTNQLHY